MHPHEVIPVNTGYEVQLIADHLAVLVHSGSMTMNELREAVSASAINNNVINSIDKYNACGLVNPITPEDTRVAVNAFIDDEIDAVRRDPLLNWFQKRKRIKELKKEKSYD